ncbi:alkylbase DNA glycosidase-like protein mag2 [Arachis stenosperma]|uniref:alkylbase DNA glycosidase-like protein mag2 n=1 Tax=Arachis stenosperma TaxID=217475 RepID=UPI0025ACF499|nr:alkylbase DNA glycosidase-like protein mag2 [Arachis stenosperma]
MKRTRSQTKESISVSKSESLTASSSKLPFRAKKIPRLPSSSNNNKNKETLIPEDSTPPPLPTPKPLTFTGEMELALHHLRAADVTLAACIDAFPTPHFHTHRSPFFSLVKSIISQQLSNKASQSIEDRFVALCGGPHSVGPDSVLALSAQQLRGVGISGPKATYLHDLASKYRDGLLSDSSILEMDDETLYKKLTMVKGIGPWSVHMFMIFTLHRPDVLPVGDLVVRRGVERLYGLKSLPQPSQMEKLCEKWKPYRSVGSWYMYRLVEAKGILPLPPPTSLL